MSWFSRTSTLAKAVGLGPQLRRRNDGGRTLDYFIGGTIGVVSGTYMFGDPLKEHFQEIADEKEAAQDSVKKN